MSKMIHLEDLEAIFARGCEVPDCKHEHDEQDSLVCRSRCHPKSPVDPYFWKHRGCLTLICRECNAIICEVAIASREGSLSA
jgi:hypothetical protein